MVQSSFTQLTHDVFQLGAELFLSHLVLLELVRLVEHCFLGYGSHWNRDILQRLQFEVIV